MTIGQTLWRIECSYSFVPVEQQELNEPKLVHVLYRDKCLKTQPNSPSRSRSGAHAYPSTDYLHLLDSRCLYGVKEIASLRS